VKRPPLALRIDRLTIAGGQVAFADLSLPLQPRSRLEPVTFTLKDLRTSASGSGDFTFAAASDAGERFDWRGVSLTRLVRPAVSRSRTCAPTRSIAISVRGCR
jgi:hypothetical protein